MDIEQLVALESKVWDALVNGDAVADSSLLAPGFVGVYATGVADRSAHAGQLANGPTVASYEIVSPLMQQYGDDHAMLSYQANFRRPNSPTNHRMYVSSVWARGSEGSGWTNVFSQDTVAASPDR